MQKILILGAKGQLGNCLKKISSQYELDYEFLFTDLDTLDITKKNQIEEYFSNYEPHFCVNAAAYTAVDLAEKENEKAIAINATGVGYLAEICAEYNTLLIHTSTDYVFDGDTRMPYTEDDFTNPINVYGISKQKGEEEALEKNPKTIVIRTSWLYSQYSKNFVKTILHLFSSKEEVNVVADQFGQPTNANDLAETIMSIIESKQKEYGIFHYANYPETNWFEFAKKIALLKGIEIKINPISTAEYPTPAKRPQRSTLCLDKIENTYEIELKHWENSLEECLHLL